MDKIISITQAPGPEYKAVFEESGRTVTRPVLMWALVEAEDGTTRITSFSMEHDSPDCLSLADDRREGFAGWH
ncbi:hypothetical protein [Luteimonas saliphila]|uniref:hypothetical protein n=1 Tax=Luteimonas saliphila TaxID=2804919 RepID=UPI00192E2D70|nr:hypothetical protein [Luteimonas saliphila]